MRLKQIKLAGFKSFVDPTSLDVPGQLVGVVGPNGCGKSNIMDAVRWVLGESRAAELRGESMQDVIFNGSDARHPAGRASVELIFDNAAQRAGGAWARFAELSVRRVLTRDGQSAWHINNQPVRRRDVHDVFLGTGLGPRAYAIIGQGTVSRIIEARPDELRVFLEEAAGVSRYRERRRETQQRLADARDNLARVDDVLRELAAQIERLDRQAEVATRWRALEAERVERQHSLWLVRRDEAAARAGRLHAELDAVQAQLAAQAQAQGAADAQLGRLRDAREAAEQSLHAAQAAFYESAGQIAQLQERIRALADARAQAERAVHAAQAQRDQAVALRDAAAGALDPARRDAAQAADAERRLADDLTGQAAQMPSVEQAAAQADAALQAARAQTAAFSHAIEIARTRARAAEAALATLATRRARLQAERDGLQPPEPAQMTQAQQALAELRAREQRLAAALADSDRLRPTLDVRRADAQRALRDAQARLVQTEARLAALEQLQRRLRERRTIAPWLARHGLSDAAVFWQRVRVDAGWEAALEAVLRERVGALGVAGADRLVALAGEAPPARCAFYAGTADDAPGPIIHGDGTDPLTEGNRTGPFTERDGTGPAIGDRDATDLTIAGTGDPAGDAALMPLAHRVQAADATIAALLHDWLHGVYAADSLEVALAARERLPAGASLVVREGHAVRRSSLQLHAPDGEQDGLLARQREIDALRAQSRDEREQADCARRHAQSADEALAAHDAARRASADEHAQAVRDAAAAALRHERLLHTCAQAEQARARIDAELSEIAAAAATHERALQEESAQVDAARAQLASQQASCGALQQRADAARGALGAAREQLRTLQRDAQQASFERQTAQARVARLEQDRDGAQQRIEEATQQAEQAGQRLAGLDEREPREALQRALAARTGRERALAEARDALDARAARLREAEQARLQAERAQVPLRERVARLQLDEQAACLAVEQLGQQLAEAGCDEAALRAGWPSRPEPAGLQARITQLAAEIAALGAVNLTALDELDQARHRSDALQAQAVDLREAVATLEDAIRRIDRETRALLKDTFEKVGAEFGRLFPRLFGGGQAKLELTGDEILDAGITVTAQPPGKRNGTIALLSGGEKALAAIALVFAMFQLNPAPFCLLDEVDAPLDDANTERYAHLVREMSAQTQFLFITHNKIAMELAQHLIGVTMQERGVSRIVAVDLQAAGRLAEAA